MNEDKESPEVINAVHDVTLIRHEEEIKELKVITFGLPQTLKRMEDVVTKLSDNIEKFLENTEKKYQSKEVCRMCVEENASKFASLELKQEKLEVECAKLDSKIEEDGKNLRNVVIGGMFAILFQIIIAYISR